MIAGVDRQAAARAIEDLLRALGHEATGALADTPRLVAEAWCDELLDGYSADPAATLREASLPLEAGARGLVALRQLEVSTICPHHLLPAHGRGDVFYLPGDRVAGFGGISRALAACTRRLVIQEQAGADMARHLVEALGARAAACRLVLTHTCLLARGARERSAVVETLALAGAFVEPGSERELLLSMLGRQHGGEPA
jgi:GTP cyclohydrolase I